MNVTLDLAILRNENGEIALCKTPFFNKLSLPCVLSEGTTPYDGLKKLMSNEYGIDVDFIDFIFSNKGLTEYQQGGEEIQITDFFCFEIRKTSEVTEKKPSGNYGELMFLSYDDILKKWQDGELSESNFILIKQRMEKK